MTRLRNGIRILRMKAKRILTQRVDELSRMLDSNDDNYETIDRRRKDVYNLLKLNMWLLEVLLTMPEPTRVRYH